MNKLVNTKNSGTYKSGRVMRVCDHHNSFFVETGFQEQNPWQKDRFKRTIAPHDLHTTTDGWDQFRLAVKRVKQQR